MPQGKMNPEAKKLWLAWLRDPNNKQGKGKLEYFQDGKGYSCCAGGLCRVAVQRSVPIELGEYTSYSSMRQGEIVVTAFNAYDAVLPPVVMNWAGINTDNIVVHIHSDPYSLTSLNDNGFTFAQIADIIDYFL